jgi:hypothetical protein
MSRQGWATHVSNAPNHGWRHRFKTVGIEAGIEHRILDDIQGHHPRTFAEGCQSEVQASMRAGAMSRGPANAGAIAFKRSGDPLMGDFSDAIIIKTFGEVPDKLDEL